MAKSYSDVARILGNRKKRYEQVIKDPDASKREINTATRMIERVDRQLDELFNAQQMANGNNGAEAPVMGNGGRLKKYAPGGRSPGVPPNNWLVDQTGWMQQDTLPAGSPQAFMQRTFGWVPENYQPEPPPTAEEMYQANFGSGNPFAPERGPVIPDGPDSNNVLPPPGDGTAPGRTSIAEQLGLAAPGTSNRALPIPGQRSQRNQAPSANNASPSIFQMGSNDILEKALGMKPKDLRGLNSNDSTALQNALLANGWELPKYGADGRIGTETLSALNQLQKARPSASMLEPLSTISTRRPDQVSSMQGQEIESSIPGNYKQRKGLLGTLRDMTSKENMRTARDIAGGVIPYAQYANAMKTARRMTPPPSPQYARAVPMQTDINVNDQLRAAREAERGFNRNVANNTVNSANANALRLSSLANRLRNEGAVREGERNMEVQLSNQAAQVNAGVDQANTQLGNQYRGMRNDFNNNRQLFRNRAFQQLGNTALGQIMDSRMRQRDENVLHAYSKMFDGNLVYRNMADLAASDKTLQSLFGKQNPTDAERQKAIAYFKENGYSEAEIQQFLKLLKDG